MNIFTHFAKYGYPPPQFGIKWPKFYTINGQTILPYYEFSHNESPNKSFGGGDLKEIVKTRNYAEAFTGNLLGEWDSIAKARKPIIAAVNGYALVGGFELTLMCDIIYAGETAKFGEPGITIGSIGGTGAGQRSAKIIGKSRAMEMNLTGTQITAKEAFDWGLISKVFPNDKAIKLAERIGKHSKIIVAICKESVKNSFETTLQQGLRLERRLFQSTFATRDRAEGMRAFIEKRPPKFTDE